jgi:prolyl oligopeptidase
MEVKGATVTTLPPYPPARRAEVADDYHGTPVADPYRWLEDATSAETQAWVAEQNARTRAALDARGDLAAIRARLSAIWDYPKYGVPYRRGGRTFFSQNDGLQNQAVLYVQDGPDDAPRVLIDPNTLSADGTAALTSEAPSRDGSLMAYGISQSGSDWQQLRVRDVATGADLPDLIQWCKFSSPAWHPDGTGFFYSRYPDPSTVEPGQESYHNKVYWHRLGTPQAEDRLVYERPDAPGLAFQPRVTDDGRYLFLHVWHGTDPTNRLYYRELDSDGAFVRLLDENDASYELIDTVSGVAFLQTDLHGPRGRIVAIDLARPERAAWQEILAEPAGDGVIAFAKHVGGRLAVVFQRDVKHELELFDLEGALLGPVALPTIGSIVGWSGRGADRELVLGLTSFLSPPTIYGYDLATGALRTLRAPELAFPLDAYEVRQEFARSKDGTRVPIFLVHRRGLELNGDAPTLLYGYGGFNISLTPQFWVSRLLWLERGGVFAVANMRGGSEYGEEWHRAGMLERKQNVFDDFIAAAEWLVGSGTTRPGRLAIAGGSNGGLLVAVCMLQRPELFGAVHCAVPVIDMLRYHRFTVGRYWVGEYGNAEESAEQFQFMLAYSPLHNVRPGVAYPPVLITTADTDDRVVPAHAYKFAATLQHADTAGRGDVFLRVDVKAGHGLGKPTAKLIEETADVYAFLFEQLGLAA